jgi:hypothetical protein
MGHTPFKAPLRRFRFLRKPSSNGFRNDGGRRSRISSHNAAVAGPIAGGFVANALDGPVGVTPVARRHVIGDGDVPMIPAGAQSA